MKYLLDTNIILWSMIDDKRLDERIYSLVNNKNNEIFYSTVSVWEVELKHLKHKNFRLSAEQFEFLCNQNYLENIQIQNKHVKRLAEIKERFGELEHNDPFDRMLLAQAMSENMVLITHDQKFKQYNCANVLLV